MPGSLAARYFFCVSMQHATVPKPGGAMSGYSDRPFVKQIRIRRDRASASPCTAPGGVQDGRSPTSISLPQLVLGILGVAQRPIRGTRLAVGVGLVPRWYEQSMLCQTGWFYDP